MPEIKQTMKIGVVGLGYVGLPLAVAFSEKYETIGFDIAHERVLELNTGIDITREIENETLQRALRNINPSKRLLLSDDIASIVDCNVYIITVPTPVTKYKTPDLSPLLNSSATIGKILKKGDIVIYESTVYPGCTEEECVPVLEKHSGLKYNVDFFCSYSPERINPGDKKNTLTTIKKVVSGSNEEIADKVAQLYNSIITAGVFKASSIKVAEASKAIENAQRDVNISFVNELALIFDKMGIDTYEVLEAAATKWNFLKFMPGLVGGHCIGVDPYYLLHKSQQLGYNPQVILSGRTVNDSMGRFIASKTIKLMIRHNIKIVCSKCLVLGFTFKENCPDIRNTKVIDVINELKEFGINVDVYDPYAIKEEVKAEYGIDLQETMPDMKKYEAIIIAVAHDEFKKLDFHLVQEQQTVIFDVKGILDKHLVHGRL
ncbi:MAG: nucleotide sugar dehydrogenase [Bacteroidales bacterium]|jgi:UDP-N-acetyl-D-galactosamine dehydrogenase|nr:nucleotide sugar dehydrogenase [Bacteroidales bacterium]